MVGSMVLTLAPEDQFLLPGNGTSAGNVSDVGVGPLVDTEAMEARRIVVASTMTVLIGIIQVWLHHYGLKCVIISWRLLGYSHWCGLGLK